MIFSTSTEQRSVYAELGRLRVLPVAQVGEPATAEPLAKALLRGGLPCVEVTLRTPRALEVITVLAGQPGLLVGAGTVTTPTQVEQVAAAGAAFVVSPGFSTAVVGECQRLGVPVLPGVATGTELMMALDAGLAHVKFFPAQTSGGIAALSALSAPFADVRFVPTGGITADLVGTYLAHPAVLAVGGTWMVTPELLAGGRFQLIQTLAAEAVAQGRAGGVSEQDPEARP
jgi:2-dehydro-3-deoxyphosphogluconate aldolase/(4S)-4-hydroxy-2-oxoglutarate aldolase